MVLFQVMKKMMKKMKVFKDFAQEAWNPEIRFVYLPCNKKDK
jgi:hypothetical protein